MSELVRALPGYEHSGSGADQLRTEKNWVLDVMTQQGAGLPMAALPHPCGSRRAGGHAAAVRGGPAAEERG